MEVKRVDFLSNLPHEILKDIVSRVPMKEAIRTCVLSTSWKSLWTPIQINLNFDSNQMDINEELTTQAKAMSTFLNSCRILELWKFTLRRAHVKERDDLVFSAMKGKEKEIFMDFSSRRTKQVIENFNLVFDIPSTCKHCIEANYTFSSVKTLHFRSVNNLSKNLVSTLFTNCELLESLKLEKCNGLQFIDINGNNFLHSFIVVDCPDMISIKVWAPKLKLFWYQGVLPLIDMKDCQDLVDVILNFGQGLGLNEFDCEDILSLLASLKDIETLTISGWLLEWLCMAGVIFGKLEFKLNNLKELCWIVSSTDRTKRDSLACFLNVSPFLEKLFVNIDQSCTSIPPPFFHLFWHEPHLWMDHTTVTCNDTSQVLQHLKTVKLVGFTDEEDQLLLMDLLFYKAFFLKLMIVISPENETWCVSKIPQSQLKQTSRSYAKQIGFSYPIKDCFFGLVEYNNHDLNAQCL